MSVTVTIHRGELKRIRQLTKKEKISHGQLYGLWTHSNQPVIQYVIGESKGGEAAKFLRENHGLQQVGCWSTEELKDDDGTRSGQSPLSFVNMTVELVDNGKAMNVKLIVFEGKSKLDGVLETLEGHSAFRLRSPFSDQKDQKNLAKYHATAEHGDLDVTDLSAKPSCEAETKEEQWYSSQEGMQLFAKIHGALQEKFEITGTSRDTKTHDLCVTLKYKGRERREGREGRECAVEFPSSFPHRLAMLTAGNRKKEIHLTKTAREGKESKDTEGKSTAAAAAATTAAAGNDAAEPQEQNVDPEEIPQLLTQEIYRLLVGTKV